MQIVNLKVHGRVNPIKSDDIKAREWLIEEWVAIQFQVHGDPEVFNPDTVWTMFCPAGYVTDFASIPWTFMPFIGRPTDRDFQLPALFHDLCFTHHCVSFKFANALFRALLKHEEISYWKRWSMWGAVATFGRFVWSGWTQKEMSPVFKSMAKDQIEYITELQNANVLC